MKNTSVTFQFLAAILPLTVLSACASSSSSHPIPPVADIAATASGAISPASQTVNAAGTARFSSTGVTGATHYRWRENPDGNPVGGAIARRGRN